MGKNLFFNSFLVYLQRIFKNNKKMKYKAFFNNSSDPSKKEEIGVFDSAEAAAKACYNTARNNGSTYSCDVEEMVIDALVNRGFYCVGYGPCECSIEEC